MRESSIQSFPTNVSKLDHLATAAWAEEYEIHHVVSEGNGSISSRAVDFAQDESTWDELKQTSKDPGGA